MKQKTMATQLAKLALITALFVVFQSCRAQQGTCYESISRRSGFYRLQPYTLYYLCGWSRCSRLSYRSQAVYWTTYSIQSVCCTGYQSCDSGCCPVCSNGDIRLRGGSNSMEGRVEICYNMQWGTVCDDAWGSPDANVACRQLGFSPTGATAHSHAFFGEGTGSILLDQVGCTGTENRLVDCYSNPVGVHDCSHFEDAGVTCQSSTPSIPTLTPTTDVPTQSMCTALGLIASRAPDGWNCFTNQHCDGVDCTFNLGFSGTYSSRVVILVCHLPHPAVHVVVMPTSGAALFNETVEHSEVLDYNRLVQLDFTLNQLQNAIGLQLDVTYPTSSPVRAIQYTVVPIDTSNCQYPTPLCTNGDIRLQGGTNLGEGRVEICNNNQWGTVCDDLWDSADANVACRQLGFSSTGAIARSQAFFGQGTGAILLDQVGCSGTETHLVNCSSNAIGVHDCSHTEDAGVTCQNLTVCTNGDIRLQGSTNLGEGRVEICNNNQWGTVCDDLWDSADANVACRQLGFSPTGAIARSRAFFGQGTGAILLDQVACSGTETHLVNCSSNAIGIHDCSHTEDAGVTCQGTATTAPTTITASTDGTSTATMAPVTITASTDGTATDSTTSIPTLTTTTDVPTQNMCTALGLIASRAPDGWSCFTNQHCDGVDCTLNLGSSGTYTSRVVILVCHLPHPAVHVVVMTTSGAALFNETVDHSEVVDYHGILQLDVTLNQLQNAIGLQLDVTYLNSAPIHAIQYTVIPIDTSNCQYPTPRTDATAPVTITASTDRTDAATTAPTMITASTDETDTATTPPATTPASTDGTVSCENGDIRLVGGTTIYEGRVEICWNEAWGTVCDDSWSPYDAIVACRQLGYQTTGAQALTRAHFGQGTGLILLDELICNSRETQLVNCAHRGIGVHDCTHSEDAGLRCQAPLSPCDNGDIRLRNGSDSYRGRIEICNNNAWGTVCDDLWVNTDASVACRQLGFISEGAIAHHSAYFGEGTGSILLDDIRCTGTETRLMNCLHNGIGIHNCHHSKDAGIFCQNSMDVQSHNFPMCTALALIVSREPEYSDCSTNQQCDGIDCIINLGPAAYRAHAVIHVCQLPRPAVLLVVLTPNGIPLVNETVDRSEVIHFQGLLQINVTLNQLQNAIGLQIDVTYLNNPPIPAIEYTVVPINTSNCQYATPSTTATAPITNRASTDGTGTDTTPPLAGTASTDGIDTAATAPITTTVSTDGSNTAATAPITTTVSTDGSTLHTAFFQLRLVGVGKCSEWTSELSTTARKLQIVTEAVVMSIEQACRCGFTTGDISNTEFKCFGGNPDKVTFRGKLSTPVPYVNVSTVLLYLNEWIESNASINVDKVALAADPSCTVEIQSMVAQECQSETVTTSRNIAPAAAEGVSVAIVLIAVVVFVLMVVMAYKYYRNRHRRYPRSARPLAAVYSNNGELSDFPKNPNEYNMEKYIETAAA